MSALGSNPRSAITGGQVISSLVNIYLVDCRENELSQIHEAQHKPVLQKYYYFYYGGSGG